jgi:pyruvate/2-oxoglutarate dehydrogenase complex dihydrolipoamide dehydrogenase (E3) component
MAENDRARCAMRTAGYVRLIAGPRPLLGSWGGGRLLGATIVGDRAGEMIHEAALAMRTGMFVGRLAQLAHAYPTWSVGVQKCAAQFFLEIEGRRARTVA